MSLKVTESLHGSAIPLIYPYCVLHELAEGVPHVDDTLHVSSYASLPGAQSLLNLILGLIPH